MKFTKLNGNNLINLNISKYLVDWDRAVSKPQKSVKDFLYQYWRNHIVLEELRIPGSLLRIDLCNLSAKVIVEVSPDSVHLSYNAFMHHSRAGFLKKIKADFAKQMWGEKNGFTYIELYDEDIKNISAPYLKEKFDLDL